MGSVVSDNFSYLDSSSEELLAKGDGGMRQMHNYMSIMESQSISTPPDNYEPDKVGTVDMGKLQSNRELDLRQNR